MLPQNCKKRKILKELGEDAAYTFKGLYKTADWLRLEFKILVLITLLFSLIILGFGDNIPDTWSKILSITALIASIWLLINQGKYEKVKDYMRLANQFKNLYDKIRNSYYSGHFKNIPDFQNEMVKLRRKTHKYPIGKIARWWSKYVIKDEMNLEWIYKNDCHEV